MTAFDQAVYKARKYLETNPEEIRATLNSALSKNIKTKKRACSRNGPFKTEEASKEKADVHNFIYRHK